MPLPEKALITQIRRMAKSSARGSLPGVIKGIGDDCAILRPPRQQELLVTTDFSLEGIHFRRNWHSPESIGHRCLARGLSDIAGMGGEPFAAFLSLALPRSLPQSWVSRFTRSLLELAKTFNVTLAGGDTAESPNGILADIIVIGAALKGRSVLRSGARPGDRIFVSGELGGSAAAILQMRSKARKKLNPRDYPRHFYPEPRIEVGRILRQKGLATAMIDISDGLSTDLAHLCEESGVGAELEEGSVPRACVGRPAREVSLDVALHGGEDYELLFTTPAGKRVPARIAGVRITQIGDITRRRTLLLRSPKGTCKLEARGWEHFRQ